MKEAMMAAVAAFLSVPMFCIGHMLSKIMWLWDFSAVFLYRPYSRLMIWSAEVEEWAGVEIMWKIAK